MNNPEKILTDTLRVIAIICISAVGALILFSLGSCSSIQKAEQKVLLDPAARHNVFLKELQFYPCVNDSVVTYLQGRTDTLSIEKVVTLPIIDEKATNKALDSIRRHQTDQCNEAIKKAFDLGVETATDAFSRIKIPVKQPDTAKYMILDKQAWKLLDDSLQRAERHISRAEQSVIDATKTGKDYLSERNWWAKWAVITWIICIVGIILGVYLKFRK